MDVEATFVAAARAGKLIWLTEPGGRYIVLRHRGRTIVVSSDDDPAIDRLARTVRFE